ncbi:hypothetical protein IAU60_000964 [Kwoniella sp. DSM 27419]
MEAIRPSHPTKLSAGHVRVDPCLSKDEDELLPPPPAPFPLDALGARSSSPVPDMAGRRQDILAHLSSVQRSCITALTSLLPPDGLDTPAAQDAYPPADAQMAAVLTDMLEVTYELEDLLPSGPSVITDRPQTLSSSQQGTSVRALDELLQELLAARAASASDASPASEQSPGQERLHPAVNAVRAELAWERLDSLDAALRQLTRGQAVSSQPAEKADHGGRQEPSSVPDSGSGSPPRYERHASEHRAQTDDDSASLLPPYRDQPHPDTTDQTSTDPKPNLGDGGSDGEKTRHRQTHSRSGSVLSANGEKMMHELDAVTAAIERLASIAPRLQDQRVDMGVASSSSAARLAGSAFNGAAQARLERAKLAELEEIWTQIERAHGRRRYISEDRQRVDRLDWETRGRERFLAQLVEQDGASRLVDQDSLLRDRDHFLRDLLEQSGERRMSDQDSVIPDGTGLTREQKKQAFISNIVAKATASRLSSQDFPSTIQDRLADRRRSYIESLVDYSSSGRLHDQDSLPSTPRKATMTGVDESDPFEMVSAVDFLKSSPGASTLSQHAAGAQEGASDPISSCYAARADEDGEGKPTASGSTTPTGLRKIAGMMRRSSSHLKLKPSNGLDSGSIAFIAEHQENLRAIQIALHGVGVPHNLDLEYEVSPTGTETVVTSKRDAIVMIRIPLPVSAIPGQRGVFTFQTLCYEAKIAARPMPPSAISLLPSYPLSASELRKHHARTLCCTSCEREVSTLPVAFETTKSDMGGYKDLPSEHWAEMMEVWMCHNDPSFTARLAEQTKVGFWPKDGGVLVGGSYLLLEKERLKKANVEAERASETEPWDLLSCLCGEVLGKQRTEDGKPGAGAVRLSKWAVALLKEDDQGAAETLRHPLSLFVVSDMLELAQAHASHRFVVSEEESGTRRIYMWLFNPSVRLAYRHANQATPSPSPLRATFNLSSKDKVPLRRSSAHGKARSDANGAGEASGRSIRAAKILYKVVEPADGAELDSLPGFGAGGQVEHLTYPATVCERLARVLRHSNAAYPLAKRSMGKFDVGFLERV